MMCASVTFWLTLSLFALGFLAQDVGFDLDGAIDAATTADDTLFNSGGTISVNGFAVTVPKNIQVGFPASWVPWRDFVTAWKDGKFPGFEVSVVGNFVNGGGPIAAQVYVSSLFTQGSSGFISQVNFDGTMKIANGPTIRINDPNAVYSSGYTESPFMTADDAIRSRIQSMASFQPYNKVDETEAVLNAYWATKGSQGVAPAATTGSSPTKTTTTAAATTTSGKRGRGRRSRSELQ